MSEDAARAELRAALGGEHRGEGAGAVGAYGANAHVRPPLVFVAPTGAGES